MGTTKALISLHIPTSDSITSILAKSKTVTLQLDSVAEQAGLSFTWLQTPKDRFSCDVAHTGQAM